MFFLRFHSMWFSLKQVQRSSCHVRVIMLYDLPFQTFSLTLKTAFSSTPQCRPTHTNSKIPLCSKVKNDRIYRLSRGPNRLSWPTNMRFRVVHKHGSRTLAIINLVLRVLQLVFAFIVLIDWSLLAAKINWHDLAGYESSQVNGKLMLQLFEVNTSC